MDRFWKNKAHFGHSNQSFTPEKRTWGIFTTFLPASQLVDIWKVDQLVKRNKLAFFSV